MFLQSRFYLWFIKKNLKKSNKVFFWCASFLYRHNPLSSKIMKKNMLKMFLMSGVVVVAFSSCDHLALSLSHYGSSVAYQPVVVSAPQPVVVHHESGPKHVVVHHDVAPKPQPVVVQHKPAPKPQPVVQRKPEPKPVAQHKPVAKPQPAAQYKPAAKPKPVAQNKPAAKPQSGKERKPQMMAHNNHR